MNRISNKLSPCLQGGLILSLFLLASAGISHASTPYSGTPIAIPGIIEAEDYDRGGEGDAYHDVDAGNNGPASYRTDDVDHEVCTEGGFNVGWTATDEWLKYTVNVASNGSYTITARVASLVATGAFHIKVDDVDATGTIAVGATGGWQSWDDRTAIVTLSAGQHVIKLVIEGPDVNINRFDITYNGPPPEAPTGLQVDSTGINSVSLSWTAPDAGSPTGYNVKRATSSGGTYTTVGTTTAPAVTFTDAVTGGSTYYYKVSALTAGGESADSSFVSATPSLGVPNAPTGLAATPGDNQVVLNWTAPAVGSPTSYNVKRSLSPGGGYSAITTPGAQTTTSYTDSTAVNGTAYYYVVSAVNAIGEGADSAQVNATPAVFTGIYEPFDYPVENPLLTGTAATASGFTDWTCGTAGWVLSGLNYTGLPTANNALRKGADRQYVGLSDPLSSGTKWISFLYQTSAGNSGANMNGVYFPNGGTGLYFGFGLNPQTATGGYLGLGSMNTTGTGAQSASLLKQLTLGTYGAKYLVVLKIDFNTSGANDTVTAYINPVANQAVPGVPAAGIHSTFDVGTISGVGVNVTGGGEVIIDEIRIADTYSDVVDAVTTPPNTPTGLNATSGSNLVSLSWNAATGSPISYNVKRSTASGGPYTNIIGTTTDPTVSYSDSILGGQTYYYVVSAVNGIGESADSSYASATPILAAPETPASLTVTVGDSQVNLSWNASAFATGYDVKRATDINGPYVSIDVTTDLTYDDFGVNNAVTYYYVVTAIGAGGASSATSPVSGTPFGPLPLVLNIDPGVGITWFASNSVTYQVQWSSEDLGTNTVWNSLGESISGNGETNTVFDSAGHNYYRVLSIQ